MRATEERANLESQTVPEGFMCGKKKSAEAAVTLITNLTEDEDGE